jgi:hypothetical protein
MIGFDAIPERWKSGIAAIADSTFAFTEYSFTTISESTIRRALRVITLAGGTVTAADVTIPRQAPRAWRLEQWNPGDPAQRLGASDAAWHWSGAWVNAREPRDEKDRPGKAVSDAGASVELTFTGVGVAVTGSRSSQGGRADVYLDGTKAGTLDAFILDRTNDDALWHTFDLRPGTHTLRIVVRADADTRSTGHRVVIANAVTYSRATR